LPEPALVTKKRMLSGAFGAFCARATENPSDRSAIQAKRDSVFIGDFMIDLSLGVVRGDRASRTLIRFYSTHHLRHGFVPADRRTSNCIPLDYKNKSPGRGF
jgi:hypothetical protein